MRSTPAAVCQLGRSHEPSEKEHSPPLSDADASVWLGKHEESLRDQELALATLDAQLGPDHPEGWQILQGMAEALLELGRPREPRDRAARAIAVTEAAFGPDHPTLVASLTAAANAELHLGNLAAARALLDRASPILAATNLPQLVRADFLLARACAARAADARADARSLATEARTYAADAGASGARVLAAIDAWLAETPGR